MLAPVPHGHLRSSYFLCCSNKFGSRIDNTMIAPIECHPKDELFLDEGFKKDGLMRGNRLRDKTWRSVKKNYKSMRPFLLPTIAFSMLCLVALASSPNNRTRHIVRLAMIGNSMQYYNDLPRLLEAMADGKLEQNSCLHGNADFSSHLWYGNGMHTKWMTGAARIWEIEDYEIYDYGACSPQQLLFGVDDRLVKRRRRKLQQIRNLMDHYNYTANRTDDDLYQLDDDAYNVTDDDAWEYGLEDDGTNPCLMDENYNDYMEAIYEVHGAPNWDYVLLNDNTRNACCTEQRNQSADLLESVYLPWIKQIHATPIFMMTYGYWASTRDMSGLIDIPTFASLTYEGYKQYLELAQVGLPEDLQPRIAPVGLAFLMVWEENPSMWQDLMHYDEIHLSPSGTFLEACVVYATIYGTLPSPSVVLKETPSHLWSRARRMVPPNHEQKPFPSLARANYLYHVAHRIVVLNEMPQSLINYKNHESVNFVPNDDAYSSNAIYYGS